MISLWWSQVKKSHSETAARLNFLESSVSRHVAHFPSLGIVFDWGNGEKWAKTTSGSYKKN
jgi:hypothetical protein